VKAAASVGPAAEA